MDEQPQAENPRWADHPKDESLLGGAVLTGGSGKPLALKQAYASLPPSHEKMLEALREIRDKGFETNVFLGQGETKRLRAALALVPPGQMSKNLWRDRVRLGNNELRLSNEQEAIEQLGIAYQQVAALKDQLPPDWIDEAEFRLGVAYLRFGESQNCCQRHTIDSCLLPIEGQGVHVKPEGSEKAIHHFMEVLGRAPKGSRMQRQCQWLLNVAYMTIGRYPQDVPAEWLIPPSALASEESFPRLVNVAKEVGLDRFNLSGGAIADDFDGDGFLDVVTSTMYLGDSLKFYRNTGKGVFEDRSVEANFEGLFGGLNLVHADYDNDGDLDLLVLRGGWMGEHGVHPRSLLKNDGHGHFVDVTVAAGLNKAYYPSQTAAWADIDNDGDLDLFIGNEEGNNVEAPCQLFRNNGDGTFTDIAEKAGVLNHRYAKGVTAGDYDGDRLPDFYVSNQNGLNRLYHNNGDGTFTDVAPDLGVGGPFFSFPCWFWDYDNDGGLDIFVSSYSTKAADLAAIYTGQTFENELHALYHNDGKGGFQDVAWEQNLRTPCSTMGSNFGDLDNDGYLDFYLGTGDPEYFSLMPNVLYRNRRGQGFANITAAAKVGSLQKGHGVFFADLDHDGDQDLFEEMGGAYPGDRYYNALYENPGFGNNWAAVRLVGKRSNRFGVGARIKVEIDEAGEPRSIYRHMTSGSSFGGNSYRQHFGLGKADKIRRLEVFWPTTGVTQQFDNLPSGRLLTITEDQPEAVASELPTFKLGGESR
ncbi:MAG: CRTAC1 family protein [Pirellulales bacterium]